MLWFFLLLIKSNKNTIVAEAKAAKNTVEYFCGWIPMEEEKPPDKNGL